MIVHKVFLIVFLMREVEEQSSLEGGFCAFEGFLSGVVVEAEGIIAASLIDMIVLIIGLPEQFVIDSDGFPVLSHVEVAVGEPETVLDLDVDIALAFQKGNCSDPVSLFYVILQHGHLLLLYFAVLSVFTH
jgi:hypothetical protein